MRHGGGDVVSIHRDDAVRADVKVAVTMNVPIHGKGTPVARQVWTFVGTRAVRSFDQTEGSSWATGQPPHLPHALQGTCR